MKIRIKMGMGGPPSIRGKKQRMNTPFCPSFHIRYLLHTPRVVKALSVPPYQVLPAPRHRYTATHSISSNQ